MKPGWNTQLASDVARDGIGLELVDAERQVVAEVFRCDADRTVTVTVFDRSIPTEVLEQLVQLARTSLGPFEDGKPLPPDFKFEEWG